MISTFKRDVTWETRNNEGQVGDAHARIRTGTTWTEIQYTLHSLPQMDKENCAFLLSVSVIRATIILGDELEG